MYRYVGGGVWLADPIKSHLTNHFSVCHFSWPSVRWDKLINRYVRNWLAEKLLVDTWEMISDIVTNDMLNNETWHDDNMTLWKMINRVVDLRRCYIVTYDKMIWWYVTFDLWFVTSWNVSSWEMTGWNIGKWIVDMMIYGHMIKWQVDMWFTELLISW